MSEAETPSARREAIGHRLDDGHAVSAARLAAEFGVSEDAVRRDLRALAAQGRCRRVYGGALPLVPATTPMTVRLDQQPDRKGALAAAAARTVQPGEFLFLDSSSTNLALVPLLAEDADLTLVTNSVPIAAAVLERQDIQLVMIGGTVDLLVGGCVDASAAAQIAAMRFDRLFLGACALAVEDGITVHGYADAGFKRSLLGRSRNTVVLLTNDKLGQVTHHRIAGLDEISTFILEADAPRQMADAIAQAGGTVIHGQSRPAVAA